MQKLYNFMSVFSFAVSAAIVAGGVYVYQNKDAMVENAKTQIGAAATAAVSDALPGMLNSSVPTVEAPESLPVNPF